MALTHPPNNSWCKYEYPHWVKDGTNAPVSFITDTNKNNIVKVGTGNNDNNETLNSKNSSCTTITFITTTTYYYYY